MLKVKVTKTAVRKIFRSFGDNVQRAKAFSDVYGIRFNTALGLVNRHRSVNERISIVTSFLKNLLA